ncbi:hypothetical protein Hanom_Chr08g00749741 [Helianthus anomalus]
MNNIVTDAREKYYWDPDIMRMCKRWNDAVKNTVSTTTDQVSSGGDEAFLNKVGEAGDTIQELGGDKDATVDEENTRKTKGCDDGDTVIYDDGGISDLCLAALQTIEPGVYKQTKEGNKYDHCYKNRILTCVYKKITYSNIQTVTQVATDVVHQMDQDVNLAESSQQKSQSQNTVTDSMLNELEKINPDVYGKEMPPTTSAEETDEATDVEMQSVETLLRLAPILQTSTDSKQKNSCVC